jgi:hypothetical protein
MTDDELQAMEYRRIALTSHPDTGDTAALDDLLNDLDHDAGRYHATGDQVDMEQYHKARAAIHDRLAALVQAETERCAQIVNRHMIPLIDQFPYSHTNPAPQFNAMLHEILQDIRA